LGHLVFCVKNSISKPVLAFVATCLILMVAVLWFDLRPRETPPRPAAPPAVTGQSPATYAATSSTATVPTATETTDGLPPVIPISLTNVQDDAEKNLAHSDSVIQALPDGTQVYGGIEFWLQGLIHLQSLATRDDEHRNFRTRITVPLDETNFTDGAARVTQRGSNIATLYLLGAARYSSPQTGEKVADVIWHYAGGSIARDEIKYDVHLRDWWRTAYEDPAQLPNALTRVAWNGPNPAYKDRTLRLYRIAFVNPHPEKVIRSIEFVSAMTRPSLFVMALTLDPLMPGTRPDDFLTAAELADPELKGHMQLLVQEAGGNPLPNARVSSSFKSASAGSSGQKYTTDNNGMALVRYPDSGLQTLEVSASQDGFSSRKMLWDVPSGDTVPASYTLKLTAEVIIGGAIVDNGENPIPGATISLYRFWSGNDGNPDKKGEQPAFSTQTQTTDDQGRWQAKGLPLELLDHIGFDVKHPDFVGTNITVGANPVTEKQLRDGTHRLVLQRGLEAHGRIVDDKDNPISGATVWVGRKYYRDRQETQSDAQGRFSFHNISGGDTLFSVMAQDRSPDSKMVNVVPDMAEIVFRLKAGSVIRAHVQDESGQPVADARVALEGNPGESAYDAYEFSANTDSQGNFSWDSAPHEEMPFYFFHDGFEAKRAVKLAPNQDNTVTLRKSRQLQGLVLDDTSEQPVTKFTVRTGHASPDGSDVYGVIRYKDFSAADGRFTMSLEEEEDDAVAIYADGYTDKIEKIPEAQNGTVQVVIRMKPSASLSGVVLAPDGTPAPGVNVAVGSETPRTSIQLSGGRLISYDSHTKMATTDANGNYKIPSVPDDGNVVVAGEPGFARAPLAEVRDRGTITLQPWGRIEGTLKIGGQPGVGKDLLFNLSIPGIGTDFNGYKSTTDGQGQFTMEKIPPGEGAIVRLIKTSPNSWSWSGSTSVTIKPGETTPVTIGDNGAMIVGRVRFDNPPTNNAAVTFEGSLSGRMPPAPAFNSPAEAQAYYKTPEWQALMKLHKNYSLEMNPDGSFETDDVAPGIYSLNIIARLSSQRPWEHPALAQGSGLVTVPDSFSPTMPIDLGEIPLKPNPQP
jgi:uncharacterized GH25 family protein